MELFESYERRVDQILPVLRKYGIGSIEETKKICDEKGVDVAALVSGIQPICFENAKWAYTVGAAIAIKKGEKDAVSVAKSLGEGLQAFCIPGSVADDRKVGLGHGNLAAMLLSNETKCFCFLAGHESFAAAEGAIGIARSATRQKTALKGSQRLGKDAAQIFTDQTAYLRAVTVRPYTATRHRQGVEGLEAKGGGPLHGADACARV
jgi:hypothetical protein